MINPSPHPRPRIEVENETLELARRIIRLSMNENDMAKGLKASVFAAVLLNRLIAFYDRSSEALPGHLPEMEEELLTRILDDVSPLVARKTEGQTVQQIIRQLVAEVNQNRQERRLHKRRPQKPHSGPAGAHKKRSSKHKLHHTRRS